MTTPIQLNNIRVHAWTWSNPDIPKFGSFDIDVSYVPDEQHPTLAMYDLCVDALHNHIVVGIDDPGFQLITTGRISGEQIIVSGLTTNGFKTIDHLSIPRGNGINRMIKLVPMGNLGYRLDVEANVGIGYNSTHLSDKEKRFYSTLFITRYEPTYANLITKISEFLE